MRESAAGVIWRLMFIPLMVLSIVCNVCVVIVSGLVSLFTGNTYLSAIDGVYNVWISYLWGKCW